MKGEYILMAILTGVVVNVIEVTEKSYDSRKYFSCLAIGTDKKVYKFSTSYDDQVKVNDKYQMIVDRNDKDMKAVVRYQKEA